MPFNLCIYGSWLEPGLTLTTATRHQNTNMMAISALERLRAEQQTYETVGIRDLATEKLGGTTDCGCPRTWITGRYLVDLKGQLCSGCCVDNCDRSRKTGLKEGWIQRLGYGCTRKNSRRRAMRTDDDGTKTRGHQNHGIPTGSFLRNPEKKTSGKIKNKLNQGLWLCLFWSALVFLPWKMSQQRLLAFLCHTDAEMFPLSFSSFL